MGIQYHGATVESIPKRRELRVMSEIGSFQNGCFFWAARPLRMVDWEERIALKYRPMAMKEITRYPDPILRKTADGLEKVTDDVVKLCRDMIETMRRLTGQALRPIRSGWPSG